MSRLTAKRPITPNKLEATDGGLLVDHWSKAIYDTCVTAYTDSDLNFSIEGGSDNGEFPYFGSIADDIYNRSISKDDILLEIQGQKISGYTQRDVIAWVTHCSRNGNLVRIKGVKAGYLTKDLRQYLNTRFQKGSIDHELQNTIRDNLYLRTVPCTTRPPRDTEVNGVDYTFLTVEEFIALERSGNLLESGIYEGNLYGTPRPAPAASALFADLNSPISSSSWPIKCNHYGTPKPPKENSSYPPRRSNSLTSSGSVLPGAHASSEGKRRRNRSNVEAMAAKAADPLSSSEYSQSGVPTNTRSSTPVSAVSSQHAFKNGSTSEDLYFGSNTSDLGPLPENWERAYTENGEPYFIDHNTGTSQWLDPRLSRLPNKAVEDCRDDELPFGWERIDDPHYGTYYIDHVNRRTQYENPVLQARRVNEDASLGEFSSGSALWTQRAERKSNSDQSTIQGVSDPNKSPQFKRNNSLSQTTTSSNSQGATGNTNKNEAQQLSRTPSFSPVNDLSGMSRTSVGSRSRSDSARENSEAHSSIPSGSSSKPKPHSFFTRNPDELCGEFIRTQLVKSSRGFGFTIVGSDDDAAAEEFLQIKDVVPNGPAWCSGKLKTGDVLVYVNSECVLGYTHQDVVALFQSIPPGEIVHLEACRGYPLPFDPNDPNTEIVTTVAVSMASTRTSETQNLYSSNRPTNNYGIKVGTSGVSEYGDSMSRAAKSMPDLSSKLADNQYPLRHNSAGLLNPITEPSTYFPTSVSPKAVENLTVEIVKGTAGFGFTIADSAYGQKVKKILDRPRCKQLQEGDILNEINGSDVRGLPHAEVVQILKDCPCDEVARITVQRGGIMSPSKNKGKAKLRASEEMLGLEKYSGNSSIFHSTSFPNSSSRMDRGLPTVAGGYRSKTPTADLYSSRNKEQVVVKRPKTPLVDTRHWSRTSSDLLTNDGKSRHSQDMEKMLSTKDKSDFVTDQLADHSSARTNLSGSSPDRHGNPSWYSDQGRGRDWNTHNFRDSSGYQGSSSSAHDLSSRNGFKDGHQNNASSHHDHSGGSQTFAHRTTVLHEDSISSTNWRTKGDSSDIPISVQYSQLSGNNFPVEHSQPGYMSNQGYSFLHNYSVKSALHSGHNYKHNSPHYIPQVYNSNKVQDSVGSRDTHVSSPHGYSGPSMYSSSTSQRSVDHLESLNHRKHSTSFEHEHPVSSSVPLYGTEFKSNFSDQTYLASPAHLRQVNGMVEHVDMTVTLHRQESGFGFRIVGGTEEGSQVSIGHIVPGGSADLDGRLQSGDEILGVNGHPVFSTSHHHVVQLMGSAAASGKVTLHVRRRLSSPEQSIHSKSTTADGTFPYDVTVTRNESEGFGFVIISSVSKAGSTIGRIIEGSPAERCGQLHVGDTILAVNGISILNMHHGDIVNLIKDSGYSVRLTIGHPLDDVSSSASASQKGDVSVDQDDYYQAVELRRGTKGFGFSIRGGKEFHNMPLFVLRIAEKGPAHQDGRIQVGDEIIEINNISTKDMTHAEAIELIRQGGNFVRLLVKRGNKSPTSLERSSTYLLPLTPVSLSPLSSPVPNGPVCQSSPRGTVSMQHSARERDIYNWSYEPC